MLSFQDDGCRLAHGEDGNICTSNGLDDKLEQMDFDRDTIPSTLHTVVCVFSIWIIYVFF